MPLPATTLVNEKGEEEEASDDDGCTWGYTTYSTEHLKDPRWYLVAPVTSGGSAMRPGAAESVAYNQECNWAC